MAKLVFIDHDLEHRADAAAIVEKLSSIGYEISVRDAHAAWQYKSEMSAAGWLSVPHDPQAILDEILGTCDVVQD